MICLSDNARNVSTFNKSKLLLLVLDSTVSHVLRDQTFDLDRSTVNCFEDSKHAFLFKIENAERKEN